MKKILFLPMILALLFLIPSVQAKRVNSWEHSCRIDWGYLYNEYLPLFTLDNWNSERGDKHYRGYLDLNRDGTINILDAGTLNWMIVKAMRC